MCMFSQRGNIEHVMLGKGEALYGQLPASPLTKEQLLVALADIQLRSESNMDALLLMDGYEGFPDGMERQAAEKCAQELYSDALLEALNKDMKPLYVAFCSSEIDSDAVIMTQEGYMDHGIKIMSVIHDKPAACVGSRFESGGGVGGYTNYSQVCTYIDIDGRVITVHEHTILTGENEVLIGGRELVEADDELSLDLVQDHFPETYHCFWDD